MKSGYKVLLIVGLITLAHTAHKTEIERFDHDLWQQKITYESMLTAQEIRLKDYFAAHGSPVPATMAKAVNKTKKKHLMAAIAVRESNADPKAVGDGGKSKGAFQVQPRHWGVVSRNAEAQARQSEWVLDQLEGGGLKTQVQHYNGAGSGAKKYSKAVTSEALWLAQELGE